MDSVPVSRSGLCVIFTTKARKLAPAMTPNTIDQHAVDRVAEILARVRSLLFITGAGVSADSGLPTYRGIGGLYNAEHPEEGFPIEQILSGEMMRAQAGADLEVSRTDRAGRAGPASNRGHEVIAEMERHFPRVWTLTQNVDGLHRRAGSRNLLEIHGSLHALRCTRCRYRCEVEDYSKMTIPPPCPVCSAILRPNVVLFGEELPVPVVELLYAELDAGFDAVFTIGTTSVFPYIAGPIHLANRRGWPSVEINPGRSSVSDRVDIRLAAGAAAALDAIWRQFQQNSDRVS